MAVLNPVLNPAPRKIAGPRPWPLFGVYPPYIRFFMQPVRNMKMRYQRFGKISGAPVATVEGTKHFLFAFGPEFNQQVLSDPAMFHSPTLAGEDDSAMHRLGEGLVFLNGERHKQHRRLVMPSFHRKHIETYRDDMVALTDQMLDRWQIGEQRNIGHDMHQLTMFVANKTLFGLNDVERSENIGKLITEWLALIASPFARIMPIDRPGFPYRRLINVSNELEGRIQTIIARKRADTGEAHDVLSTLLDAADEDGTKMSDAEVLGHTNILFIAGHETSANTLTWALMLLAQHPQILQQVLDELDGALHGDAPRVEHLGQLSLLERVLKETLRLLPPLTWVQRTAKEPFEIGGYHMPAEAGVIISHFMTHHLPELYPQPEKFLPQRWETIDPSAYEYMPFSAGPRMCIGATFAMMEMKIVLAMVLQRYRLSLPAQAQINYRVLPTLSTRDLNMTVHTQDRRFEAASVRGSIHELVDLPTL